MFEGLDEVKPPTIKVNSIPLAYLNAAYFKALYSGQGGINWNGALVQVTDAWGIGGTKGEGAVVAIIDTGCLYTHPDLNGNILSGYNFTASDRTNYLDRAGHATHVAGIIAAVENDFGVTGIAPQAKLLIIKVLGDDGSGSGDWVASGIRYAVSQGVDVINMSLGCQFPYDPIKFEIRQALDAGIIVCCAAGNDAMNATTNTIDWPAHYNDEPDVNGAITVVAAVDRYDSHAYFSSQGPEITIAAPGVDIYSTFLNDGYAVLSGSSMATPVLSGFAALIKSKYKKEGRTINGIEFNKLLEKSAKDLGDAGKDVNFGFGLVQGASLFKDDTVTTTGPAVVSMCTPQMRFMRLF